MPAGRPKIAIQTKAERARAGRARKRAQDQSNCDAPGHPFESRESTDQQESDEDSQTDDDNGVCNWNGGVNVLDSESDWTDEDEDGDDTDEENDTGYDLEGDELRESLQKQVEAEIKHLLTLQNVNICLDGHNITRKEWGKAERNRDFGYNGLSKRNAQYRAQKAWEKEEIDKQTHSS